MEITKDTRVSVILKEYGDIAGVMGVFGVKPVGKYSIRKILTKFIKVKHAARIHKVPLDEFLEKLNSAIELQKEKV